MHCARCGRMLLRPGVEATMDGAKVIAGPRCAEKLRYGDAGKPREPRLFDYRAPRRRRETGQRDLFAEAVV